MANSKPKNFAEFWPLYVCDHKNSRNRMLHFIGTLLVLVHILVSLGRGEYLWLWLAPIIGYSFAWVGHFLVERNRPATFRYPIYSLLADFKMFALMCRGRMAGELESILRQKGSSH